MVKGFIQDVEGRFSGSFRTPEELFRSQDIPYEEFKASKLTSVYSVNLDECGHLDTLYISEPTPFGRSIGVIFNKSADQFLNKKVAEQGDHCVDDVYSYENDKIVSNVFLGDVNGDGFKDIVIGTEDGVKVFLNATLMTTMCSVKKEPAYFRAVPDYDRMGRVHVSTGALKHYERLTDSLVTKQELMMLFPERTAEYLDKHLPDKSLIGSVSELRNAFGVSSDFRSRLLQHGVPAVVDDGNSWTQDYGEYGQIKGVAGNVLQKFYNTNTSVGGNIFFVRNNKKELFITMTEDMLKTSMAHINVDQNICLARYDKQGLEEYLSALTGEKTKILVFPAIDNFAHIDQVAFFPSDGNVIVLKLPKGHSQQNALAVATNELEKAGFEVVSEIQFPGYNMSEGISPLNIFVHRSAESGERKYFVPMDSKMHIDARVDGKSDIKIVNIGDSQKTDDKESWKPYRTGEKSNYLDEYFVYDPTDIPPHTQAVVDALVKSGVDPSNIVLFPDNGLGRGGLHCKTNTEPK